MKQTKPPFLLLWSAITLLLLPVLSVNGSGIIFIREDGSIEGTNKIQCSGNIYTLTANIEDSYGIIVEKSNLILDGNGYILRATPRILPVGSWDFGIELSNVTSGQVTVKNFEILDFNIGVYIWTTNNTLEANTIMGGNIGVFLAESPNTVVGNRIENNIEGIFLGPLPDTHTTVYNVLYDNNLVNNIVQVYDCECTDPHTIQHQNIWDNGVRGNFWSDYNGTDTNEDGIGDIPYQISDDDTDVLPLMSPIVLPLNKNEGFLGTTIPNEQGLILTAGAAVAISSIVYLQFKLRNSKVKK